MPDGAIRIAFTGTRDGLTNQQSYSLTRWLMSGVPIREARHGACLGADAQFAGDAWLLLDNCTVHAHPSDIPDMVDQAALCKAHVRHPPAPPLDRNRTMVDNCDLLLACPKGQEEIKSGTWSTVRYAKKQGVRVLIFWPDGTQTEG